MKQLISTAMLFVALVSTNSGAAEAYPRPEGLIAAQAELDTLRAAGPRSQPDAEERKRIDAAIGKRNAELDKRNAQWKKDDSISMLRAQVEACSTIRLRLDEGKKPTDYFDDLRYVGFSSDETLDIVLQISRRTPEVGKSVRVAYCILGLPVDTVRRESKNSETAMMVYPNMFVHVEDGVVTAWSDR